MKSASLRRFVLVTHRWLGLGSSVVLAIVGLSGTAFLFPSPAPVKVFLEKFHMSLMIPGAGTGIVIAATVAAVLLECGGLYLWWQRKIWTVRWSAGWRVAAEDLHHFTGAAFLAIMLLLAATGVGRVAVRQVLPESHIVVKAMNHSHTGLKFPAPVRVIYGLGGVAFLLQGTTGVIMWSRRRDRSRKTPPLPAGAAAANVKGTWIR